MDQDVCMLKQESPSSVDVILLSSYDTDGVGTYTQQVAEAIEKIGLSTQIICINNQSKKDRSFGFLDKKPIYKIFFRILQEFERRILKISPKFAFIHLNTLSDKIVLESDIWPQSCRLIITIFISGMMDARVLNKIYQKYNYPKILFMGVDDNLYTGGCHYVNNCDQYKKTCSKCPAVSKAIQPKVLKNFYRRKKYYDLINPMVIAGSNEHKNNIKASSLLRNFNIEKLILNADKIYGKYELLRDKLRDSYGVNRFAILVRSSSEPRKGCDTVFKAIKLISIESPEKLKKLEFIFIGDDYLEQLILNKNLPVIYKSFGFLEKEELAKIYTISDLFLMPSYADLGPMMMTQSLASGTPVVSSDVGLARDLIVDNKNGIIIRNFNAENLEKHILNYLSKKDSEMSLIRKNTREISESVSSEEKFLSNLKNLLI